MKIGKLYDALKYLVIAVFFLIIARFLLTFPQVPQELIQEKQAEYSLEEIPNHYYLPEIKTLKEEGRLGEALEMARFVARHPDMPGQEEANLLETELEKELSSLWARAKGVSKGFVTGSGNSIDEISGGIASDLIVWGDFRDLCKQGYYRVTGKETDPVIAVLAGVGLATEAVDFVDWAPAVLKSFRKVDALSGKFADFLKTTCKESIKARRLDDALSTSFKNLRSLTDKMGLPRTAAVFKHIDDPADLAAVTMVAQKNADAAYFTVRNGEKDGVTLIKRVGDTEESISTMAEAAKKGPAGIQFLIRSGGRHKYLVTTQIGAKVVKNVRLNRLQQLIAEIIKNHPGIIKPLRVGGLLSAICALIAFVASGRKLYAYVSRCATTDKQ